VESETSEGKDRIA